MNMRPVQQKPAKVPKNPAHIGAIKACDCIACGRAGPSEAHHCRDLPDFNDRDIYMRVPGAGMKSADEDALPLCQPCHRMFHLERAEFHALYGKDYLLIPLARALVLPLEIGF
jgi:hypothetical protein